MYESPSIIEHCSHMPTYMLPIKYDYTIGFGLIEGIGPLTGDFFDHGGPHLHRFRSRTIRQLYSSESLDFADQAIAIISRRTSSTQKEGPAYQVNDQVMQS